MRARQHALMASRFAVAAAAVAAAFAGSQAARAEDLAPTAGEAAAEDADTILVTGTRRTDRTLAESPVPVDVIAGDSLTRTGLSETSKILNQLVPSFNFPQPSIADGSDVIRPASLRGLGPDQTLVTVNGKRRHVSALLNVNGTVGRGSAAVDLNTIPTLAIERIEVLRDGASSQYGSDAIAGVINIRLRRASEGGRITASYGKYATTLSGVGNVQGLQTNGSGQPFLDPADPRYLAANVGSELEVRDGQMYTIAANIGVPIGQGFFNVTGEYRDRDATNRSGFDTRPNYNQPTPAFDPRELTFNRRSFILGDPKTEDWNVFVNAGVPVGDWEIYGFGSYGERDGLSAANYRQSSAVTNRDFSVLAPGATPTAANFVPLRPDGFLPFIGSKLKDASGTLGLKGKIAGWNVDLSAGFGHNRLDYRTLNSVNVSFGPQSQTAFDAGGLRFSQQLVNLDVVRQFDAGLAGPLSVAFGGEYRNENFKIRPGDTQSFAAGPLFVASRSSTGAACATSGGVFAAATGICSFPGRQAPVGAQGFPGFPTSAATDASRHNFSAYAELDAEVLRGLTVTAAGRFEDYSDFGSTVSGKLALRYEPVEGFALRGSFSNGFRAPSLQQQFFTTTSTNFINGLPVDISTVSVASPVARALGSRDLKAEKSTNLSLGFTAAPTRRLNLTVDYYHIKIDDRIVLTENLGAAGTGSQSVRDAVKRVLDANGFQSVGAARFFINGLDTTTKGLDAILSWRAPASALGDWTFSAAYNWNQSTIDRRINTLGPLAQIPGIVLFGRVEGVRFTDGQPDQKLVLSAEGKKGPFGLTARTTRYGRVVAPGATAPLADPNSLVALGPDDAVLSPKWITDLEARLTVMERIELAVGANNLFDVYPDRLPVGRRPDGGFYPVNQQYLPYSNFSPFGFNGRFLYARVSVGF